MGGSETDSKVPKTSASQPPATSSSHSAAAYPDWPGFQAYSPIPPPGFFHSPVVSSPQAHPYIWGPQHLMPPYGTPPPPYVMYPHGIYAHPTIPPGSQPFSPYGLPSLNGNAEVCGNMPPSAEGDAKSSEEKEKKPIRRLKGSLGSLNMITGQNNTDMDKLSGGANGVLSHGESGSVDSSEGSDANSQDSEPKTGGTQKPLDETTRNGTTSIDTTPSHTTSYPTMPLMPLLATGVPGAVPGPTTNLNIGMDYWVAPVSSAIAPTGKISATAVTGSTIPGTLVGVSGKVPSELWLQDERELKRQRRKQSNRESARRSRLRKQAEYGELAQHVDVLKEENTTLRAELDNVKKEYDELLTQNASLKERMQGKARGLSSVINNIQIDLDSDPQSVKSDSSPTHSGVDNLMRVTYFIHCIIHVINTECGFASIDLLAVKAEHKQAGSSFKTKAM
ncbi:bZIP transcription factor 1-B-like isoform X2 [Zingiber officinale]|uniref:bZIP transcription factor 1-B-like isoform X2 n=1 Tax=Zingiber officinale TaxID=94328 RepID=UPI001C4C902C|nr:bZIP transcription factor 1-B-like isoform X2 [Zingiber officinale]